MRIRQGFVSNSSSSSFVCGDGVTIDQARSLMDAIIEFDRKHEDATINFDTYFKIPFKAGKRYVDFLQDYFAGSTYEYDYIIKRAKGRVIIESVEDNSIPYEWFDKICSKLDATRLHLG